MKPVLSSLLVLLLVTAADLSAQDLSERAANDFISDLLNNPSSLPKWALADELEASRRLDISYTGVSNKFLISYDVTDELRDLVGKKLTAAEFQIHRLDSGFSKLSLTFKNTDYEVEYYFKSDRLVSPMYYYSRDWHRFESDYFVFVVSDMNTFNNYSADKLDAFVAKNLKILSITVARKKKLEEEKIYYFLCGDSNEIRDLTGYETRGMYNLAYDYIITTFNCHYHELVHLLINFKLQTLSMQTHPFFQEGAAVALGGRGGKEPPVILDMGAFLEQSQFASYQDLLQYESFIAIDPSLSYPLSGLYNSFLIKEMKIDDYLTLYQKYCAKNHRSDIVASDLPGDARWRTYLQTFSSTQTIDVRPNRGFDEDPDCNVVHSDTLAVIFQDTSDVYFKIKTPVLLSETDPPDGYECRLFQEFFPMGNYQGEKYLITANENEISVYDLYTNNLVAKYVPSMSVQLLPITVEEDFYLFSIDRSVFDGNLQDMIVTVMPPEYAGP